MQELLQHILSPFIESPEDVSVDIQEAAASHIITVELAAADKEALTANDDEALRNVRHILSIASGSKKAILRLKDTGAGEADDTAEAEASTTEDAS